MEGRWTIRKDADDWDRSDIQGPPTEFVPVVPCGDAAVERAARAACKFDGSTWDDDEDSAWYTELAVAALRAAGETP